MGRLVHKESGTTVDLAGADYERAVKSGRYAVPEGEPGVEVTLDGARAYLPEQAAELDPQYAARASVGTVSPEAQAAAEAEALGEELYGGFGQEVLTGLEGAAAGATFGASDKLLDTLGADTVARAQVNPGVRFAGELTGAIVPGIFSGGAGAAGTVARLAPSGRLVARTEQIAKSLGGLKGSLAASAVEGTAFGAGQAVSQLVINDIPLTSEAGLTEIGLGAIFGAGTGAVAGGLTYGAGRVAERLEKRAASESLEHANPFGKATPEEIERGAHRLSFEAKRVSVQLNKSVEDILDTAARRAQGARVVGSPEQLKSWMAERHAMLSEDLMSYAARARQANLGKMANHLSAAHDDLVKLSRTILDPGLRVDAKSFAALNKRMNRAEGALRKAAGDEWKNGLAQKFDDLDNKWHNLTGSGQVAPRTAGNRVGPPPVPSPELKATIAEVLEQQKAFRSSLGLSSNDVISESVLKRFQSMDQDLALNAAQDMFTYHEGLRKLASAMPDQKLAAQINGQIDELQSMIKNALPADTAGIKAADVMRDLGMFAAGSEIPDMPGPVDDLMKLYLAGRLVKSASGAAASRPGKSNIVGRYAGYKGADALNRALGVRGGAAFFLRAKGAQIGGAALGGAALLGKATGGVVARTEAATAKLLKGVSGKRRVVVPGAVTTLSKARFITRPEDEGKKPRHNVYTAFEARRDELTQLLADPMGAHRLAFDNLTPVRQAHPVVADQMEMKAVQAAQFLLEKMPKDPGTVTSFGKSRWKPSEAQLIEWANYIRAVEDPVSVLEDAANGTINPQGAEALRMVYPAIFKQAQQTLVMNAEALKENTPYDQRVRLSVLFGVAVDSSVSPDFTKFSQEFWANRTAEQQPIDGSAFAENEPTRAQQGLA